MPTSLPGTTPTRPERGSGRDGFSLIELIVVMALIIAALALFAPSFQNGLKSLELEGASRDLITRMKQARSEAIGKHKVLRIIFRNEPEGSSYTLTNDYEEEIKTYPLPLGVVFEWEDPEAPDRVSFFPNGRSSGLRFTLKNERGRRIPIHLDPVTGLARIGSWDEDEEAF